jgi:hypothetical protein
VSLWDRLFLLFRILILPLTEVIDTAPEIEINGIENLAHPKRTEIKREEEMTVG